MVFAVEPNDEMRAVADRILSGFSNFFSIKGTAEDTTLKEESVDLIAVGQALHWFNLQRAPKEFARISMPEAHLCVVYNERNKDDPFMREYDAVVTRNEGDRASVPKIDDSYLSAFYGRRDYKRFVLPNEQHLDLEGLLGRMTSASYMPSPREGERYRKLVEDVSDLFDSYAKDGRVRLLYNTTIILGQIRDLSDYST